jgi:hypothetical protein
VTVAVVDGALLIPKKWKMEGHAAGGNYRYDTVRVLRIAHNVIGGCFMFLNRHEAHIIHNLQCMIHAGTQADWAADHCSSYECSNSICIYFYKELQVWILFFFLGVSR